MSSAQAKGTGSQTVMVWNPLVRLIHWSLALTIVINGFLTDAEGWVHEWLGYAALVLVGIRLLWGVIGSRSARFRAFPPNPMAGLRHIRGLLAGERAIHLSNNPLGALMVYNIWVTVLVICVTGIMMGTLRIPMKSAGCSD